MKAVRLDIDSQSLGNNVLSIDEFDAGEDFAAFEAAYRAEFQPAYVSAKLAMERIADIHALEELGFRLVECQLRASIKLRAPYDTSSYAYRFEEVRTEDELAAVLDIAGKTFVHDRLSIDPLVGASVSGARYQGYVRHSFREANERVFRLVELGSERTVAFKTHRRVSETEVLFLLGGVHPDFKKLGLGLINEYFEFNVLIEQGIKRGVTHISAANYPVFNLEIGHVGFRVLATFAVLRKVYSGNT